MRLYGWCTVCRRLRPHVNVTGTALAWMTKGGLPWGVCDECEDEAR